MLSMLATRREPAEAEDRQMGMLDRRHFLALLAVPFIADVLASCSDDDSGTTATTGPGTGAKRESLRSDLARINADADPRAAAAAINAFADDLYAALVAQDQNANLVFSPASIALALAMTSAGAKGTTLTEIDEVLHITDPTGIHRSMNGLAAHFDSLNQTRDNTIEGGEGTSSVQLSIANSLWGQSGLQFQQAFLDLLAAEYGAGMELVDYLTDPEAARAAINDWVGEQTRERIPELLAEGTITTDSRLTLVNAIYLKANWLDEFDVDATTDETFTTGAGQSVQVRMMHRESELAYAEGPDWQAVDVPYVFNGLSFTAAMAATADTPPPSSSEVTAGLTRLMVRLGLPRFDIETATQLSQVLMGLGMEVPFTDEADFSGMTTEELLRISDVIHQANITVDEKGTEAAAATAVMMAATGAPVDEEPVVLTFDRPFTFWLRDSETGTVVFVGRVNDPSQTRA